MFSSALVCCLLVSKLAHKRLARLSQNSARRRNKAAEETTKFGGNPDHVTLSFMATVRWVACVAAQSEAGRVPGFCLTLTILRHQQPWLRYAL